MPAFSTPDNESYDLVVEFVCPAEMFSVVIGALLENAQTNDFAEDGDISESEAAQLMDDILSQIGTAPLTGGLIVDINGNQIADIYGRMIWAGVEP